jgi:hypothetical protein
MTIKGRTYGRNFWRQATERGIKSAAQAVAGIILLDQPFDLIQANPLRALGVAAGGFVLSIVTSVATAPVGPTDTPSTVATVNP